LHDRFIVRGSAQHCDSARRRPDRRDPTAATEPKAYFWRSLRGIYVSFGHSEKLTFNQSTVALATSRPSVALLALNENLAKLPSASAA
jgi:hypothetical protein